MSKNSLVTDILLLLKNKPQGVDSLCIARDFLKFNNPTHILAEKAVTAILSKCSSCKQRNGLWFITTSQLSDDKHLLKQQAWVAVSILSSINNSTDHLHISIWEPDIKSTLIYSGWLKNPESFSAEEFEQYADIRDKPFTSQFDTIASVLKITKNKTLFFINSRQQRIYSFLAGYIDPFGSEDSLLASTLMRCCELKLPKLLNIESVYKVLYQTQPIITSSSRFGEALADSLYQLLELLEKREIFTRKNLAKIELLDHNIAIWNDPAISVKQVAKCSQKPGIYAFKDKLGNYLYIGKARNLRTRLLHYFRLTDESPQKLDILRKNSHELIIHECGSEIESLIYEHRLINKHKPKLNTQKGVSERNGTYKKLPDMLLIFPHSNPLLRMSIWFKSTQKLKLATLNKNQLLSKENENAMCDFFYSGDLSPTGTDFPEMEIFERWFRKKQDTINFVDIANFENATGALNAINNQWDLKSFFR